VPTWHAGRPAQLAQAPAPTHLELLPLGRRQLPRALLRPLLARPARQLGVVSVAVPHVRVAVPLHVGGQVAVPPSPLRGAVADQAVPPRVQPLRRAFVGAQPGVGLQQQGGLLLHQAQHVQALRPLGHLHVE
jgi:hypothetical protein